MKIYLNCCNFRQKSNVKCKIILFYEKNNYLAFSFIFLVVEFFAICNLINFYKYSFYTKKE
jgi:hypothetical protein